MIFAKNILKNILSILFGFSYVYKLTHFLLIGSNVNYIRVVNYHGTPAKTIDNFIKHLEWYKNNFSNCNENDLIDFIEHGIWKKEKPGLIISFDDGLLSNFEYASNYIESYGFTGWFMIPVAFIDKDINFQNSFVKENFITHDEQNNLGQISMSWDNIRNLISRGHIIVNHTLNHKRLCDNLPENLLIQEIIDSKIILEKQIKKRINSFAWVGGESENYGRSAYNILKKTDYKFVFCTNNYPIKLGCDPYFLERTNIESHYNIKLVRFKLGGIFDLLGNYRRNKIINNLRK